MDEYHYELLRVQVETRDVSPPDSQKMKLIQVPYGMLHQVQQIRSRFDEIANDRIALQLSEGDGPKRCNNTLQIAQSSHFIVQSNIFGRKKEKENLIDFISSECDVISVVTIVGMGGVGKTTLAQLVYNDQRIQQKIDKFGWICVSEDFNVKRLTKESVESITGNECHLTNLSVLQEKIRMEIRGRRVLLVLDDVWNENKSLWDSFQAPLMSSAFAKIIVTTRNDHVAQIMQTDLTFNIGSLSPQQCWRMFEHYAFGEVKWDKDPQLVEIGKKIMKKCKMLPLAVKSIASLLRHEAKEENWRDILESELWESDVKSEIFSPLQISYARLPTYLKSCFLYCSMFPKDYEYDVEELVKLWMYQGFIESKGNKTAENIGFEYAQQLCQRSLFERVGRYDSNDFARPKFKLHDIVHDLARLNSENSCYSVEFGKPTIFPNVLYHLYIAREVKLIDPIPFEKFSPLRTLITDFPVDNFFSSFELSMPPKLRALEITGSLDCDLEFLSFIGNLKHLRYLSLSNLFFQKLPECICSLYSLKKLTLSVSQLEELPTKIGNLISLEELIINDYVFLTVLPESFCQLKSLKILFISSCDKIMELPNNIGNLVNLEELRIESCTALQVLLESLCQLMALRKVFIRNCHEIKELPNNIGYLVNLEELHAQNCSGLQVLPKSLCQLKALRKLYLIDCNILEELPSEMGSLINLQTLEIRNTCVSYLPSSLRKCVGILSLKVQLQCETIGWLKDFPDLGGTLCLGGLKNIPNLMDFQCANLVGMRNLEQLRLSWHGGGYNWDTRKIDGSVLVLTIKSCQIISLDYQICYPVMVSLHPHPNLSKLQIAGDISILFPEWIGSLCKLKYLNITSCNSLQFLKAESLPLEIEELKISECHQLVSMPVIQKLKSLVKLSIHSCQNLCLFMEPSLELTIGARDGLSGSSLLGLRNLVSLRSLTIAYCKKLQVLEDELLPVKHCNVLVIECPGLREWCLHHGINYKGLPNSYFSVILQQEVPTMVNMMRKMTNQGCTDNSAYN